MNKIRSSFEFIELNRKFHELDYKINNHDNFEHYREFYTGNSLSWPNIISLYRVIILSEAGSGKTAEIRNIAQKLRTQGKSAFFIRLEHIPNDFEISFEVGDIEEFQAWLASNDEGWLLLDSVDEANLRNPRDFELAIKKLGHRIATAKDRSHIVITGRTNAWRPQSDLALCLTHLPFTPATKTAKKEEAFDKTDTAESTLETLEISAEEAQPAFKIVTLDDLSSAQIEIFTNARKIHDAKAFLEAIERADARSFTSRPQDLMELTEFWCEQGQIGSRLEIMRNSISRRLRERDQSRSDKYPLAAEKALLGAKLIAAATILTQESTIRVPDGAENSKGIDLHDVLPDWDDREHATLLSRPIFDEAIYGTVRFHHRSVREYLAAEWFAELLSRQTSRREIEALFFTNQYGLDIIVPTLRPILPWLAIRDDNIRKRLHTTAPEVFFEGGDPSQLPLETRRLILREACEQLANGTSDRSMTNYAAVQRFSSTDLTDDVRDLFSKYATNEELKAFLLQMVWQGQLSGALPESKEIALSPSTSQYTRIAAFWAVEAVGSAQDQEDIRSSFLTEAAELDRDWLAELTKAAATDPTPDTVQWLLKCLRKTKLKDHHRIDPLSDAVSTFIQKASDDLLPELLIGFDQLLNVPPVIERPFCEISQKFSWLMMPACQAAQRLIEVRHPSALQPVVFSVLNKFGIGRYHLENEIKSEKTTLSTLVPEWPELNRALFWYEIRLKRGRGGERIANFNSIFYINTLWIFKSEDFDYVSSQMTTQPFQDDKLVALSLAFSLYSGNGQPPLWREKLKQITSDNTELSDQLSILLNPPTQGEEAQALKRQQAQWQKTIEEKGRKENSLEEKKRNLSDNLEKLRDPGQTEPGYIFRGVAYLYDQMHHTGDSNHSGRWTRGNWKSLEAEFGKDIAQAFRDGIVAFWRREMPTLRSEGAPENSIPRSVLWGLTGLEIEAKETPDWEKNLSEADIERACRYASFELNGFPTWFPKLFKEHTKVVTDFLLQEIYFELSTVTAEKKLYYVLDDLSHSGEWSWPHLGPHIARLLKESDPVNTSTLEKLLRILQGSALSHEEIATLASEKACSVRTPQHVARWYAVWTGVDPEASIPNLEAYFETLPQGVARTEFAMCFVTSLVDNRNGTANTRSRYQTPRHLKSLYLLMLQHIRQHEDINRANQGVYSLSLRDEAQDSRNALFSLLSKISGKEAFLAIQEISQCHPEEASRPWFSRLTKVKAEQDAGLTPWRPAQVYDFNDQLERTPANHRELAELAVMRLLDLKDDLENGDSSIARILINGAKCETDMRNYIGNELRQKASGRYSVPQEEELADAKRPDIRFHGIGFDAPVPVELKLSHRWSGPKFLERLENQLCGDYLRDKRSSRGIFLLIHTKNSRKWEIPNKSDSVNFDSLITEIQSHWYNISHKFPSVDEIEVIGIDLTKRTSLHP